ncbi:MAG: hypothetical protein ACYC6Q_11540, partial [Syntrophales bacterium]
MNPSEERRALTALEINLERTRAVVAIPDRYGELLAVAQSHNVVGKRTEEMLRELHHPFVNRGCLLQQLRALSTGDFNYFNSHEGGLPALQALADIYLEIISSAGSEEIKVCAVRGCLEYLSVILEKSGKRLERNIPLLERLFCRLADLSPTHDSFFKKSSGYAKMLAKAIVEKRITGSLKENAVKILFFSLRSTYAYWLKQPDPAYWFSPEGESDEAIASYRELIEPLSHEELHRISSRLEELQQSGGNPDEKIGEFLDFPDYAQIANGYLKIADAIEKTNVFSGRRHLVKLDFLFKMMGVEGLEARRNAIFTEINRCLVMALREEDSEELNDFVHKIFNILKKTVTQDEYKSSTLDCILTLAKEIFLLNNHALVDYLIEEIVEFGFQYPAVKGATAEWQVQANPAHVKNIRSWLAIIALKPRWTKKLLSALIINLELGGVFVSDADLLQKDISLLLNADILPAYNKIKQLLRIFPIYFKEIGAEGDIRTISTEVDELSGRNDRLIYFLRKQSHVESNSLLVPFIEDIFRYWQSGDKTILKGRLPAEVYQGINPAGEYFSELNVIFDRLFAKIHGEPAALLGWDIQKIEKEIDSITGASAREKKRAELMIRFYQLLSRKYFNNQSADILRELEDHPFINTEKIGFLKRAMERGDSYRCLSLVLEMLAVLKNSILSPQKTEYFEDIYYKRHIAAGIPSMYGTYREEKFEAMGLTFRLESFASTLFEKLLESLNLK